MRTKIFGQTGHALSEIGMGCMRFEAPDDIDGMAQVVLHAFHSGVNYFDTAPFYCNDKSETIVGTAVAEMKKTNQPFYISTKTGVSKAAEVRIELERSLRRLQVDAIDFYHVWCLVHPHQLAERKANGVLEEFRKCKEEGLIRHICVSTHLAHDEVASMLDEGDGLFEGMLIGLNALNFSMRRPGAIAAAERGLGVVTMNSLGGGMLTEHASHYRHLLQPGDSGTLDAALRFNLSLPEVNVALVGFRNAADVDSAVAAANRVERLSPTELEAYQSRILAASQDFCTQCNYCRDCPVDIPVLRIMESYNHRILAQDKPQNALNQLKWHWGIPEVEAALAACTRCRHCEEVCTQHLPILKRFEELREDERSVRAKQ